MEFGWLAGAYAKPMSMLPGYSQMHRRSVDSNGQRPSEPATERPIPALVEVLIDRKGVESLSGS